MNSLSLKHLAIPVAVEKLCTLSRDANNNKEPVLFPEDLSVHLVDYIFKSSADRQNALQHAVFRGIHEIKCSQLHNVDKFLPIVFKAFPDLTNLNCANSNVTPLLLKKHFDTLLSSNQKQQLDQITTLDLSGLSIDSMDFLSHLPNLEKLVMVNCAIKASTDNLQGLKSLKNLKFLDLQNTLIESFDMLPESIEELNLSGCKKISPEKFAEIKACLPNLKKLNLSSMSFGRHPQDPTSTLEQYTDSLRSMSIETLQGIPQSVEELDLSHCNKISEKELAQIKKHLPNLTKLHLNSTRIKTLKGIPQSVEELDLSDCYGISEKELAEIKNYLPNLTKLILNHTSVTNLRGIPQSVEELGLSHCYGISEEEFAEMKKHLPNLTKLHLNSTRIKTLQGIPVSVKELALIECYEISEEEFAEMKKYLPNLTKLRLNHTHLKTLQGIPQSVQELDLSDCKEISEEEFAEMKKYLPNLTKLQLDNTHLKTLQGLPHTVEELDLSHCYGISEEEFAEMKNHFSNLKKLILKSTKVSNLQGLPHTVEELVLAHCEKISVEELVHLGKYANLKYLYFFPSKPIDISAKTLKDLALTIEKIKAWFHLSIPLNELVEKSTKFTELTVSGITLRRCISGSRFSESVEELIVSVDGSTKARITEIKESIGLFKQQFKNLKNLEIRYLTWFMKYDHSDLNKAANLLEMSSPELIKSQIETMKTEIQKLEEICEKLSKVAKEAEAAYRELKDQAKKDFKTAKAIAKAKYKKKKKKCDKKEKESLKNKYKKKISKYKDEKKKILAPRKMERDTKYASFLNAKTLLAEKKDELKAKIKKLS